MTPAEVLELKAWWAERLMPWHADESAKENPTVAVIALCDMVLELRRQLDVIAMTESVKG